MGLRHLKDEALAEDIREVLANDHRLARLAGSVSVEVRGGVAHVQGRVPDEGERCLLRRLLGRVKGIHAVWDVVEIGDGGLPSIVDIGCGNVKQHAFSLGVDRYPHPAVNVVADLEKGLPFGDESVDQVYAIHVLEHVRELLAVMNDIHRILKPQGVLHVMVPQWQCVNAVADPTHIRFFHQNTFKYFCQARPGLQPFRPLAVAATPDDLFADLQPIKDGGAIEAEEGLCRYFD